MKQIRTRHGAVETALGRAKYAEAIYQAGYKSARHTCAKEAKRLGLTGMAVVERYLELLSARGWGRFSFIAADPAAGSADIRLDPSALVLARAETCAAAKTCYMFSGWLAGAMDWVGGQTTERRGAALETLCCETQCGAEGHGHCVFAVRPRGMSQSK